MIVKSSYHIQTIRKYKRISLSSAFSFLTSSDHPGVNSDAHASTTTTTTAGTNNTLNNNVFQIYILIQMNNH